MKYCINCADFKGINSIKCQNCNEFHENWTSNGKPEVAVITIEEVRKLALKYYKEGGDGVYECYEDFQIEEEINAGAVTEADWLNIFGVFFCVGEDIQNS